MVPTETTPKNFNGKWLITTIEMKRGDESIKRGNLKLKYRFQVPSSRNYFCEIIKIKTGYKLTFFHVGQKIKEFEIIEDQIDREYLRKMEIKIGIEFYALTGPYDFADELLRIWHKHYKKKGLLERILKNKR